MSVYESLCLRSPIWAARARPAARVRGQIASDHCRSDLITGRTHWARAGYPFPEVNLPETGTDIRAAGWNGELLHCLNQVFIDRVAMTGHFVTRNN